MQRRIFLKGAGIVTVLAFRMGYPAIEALSSPRRALETVLQPSGFSTIHQ
jgi:hypothetical protein